MTEIRRRNPVASSSNADPEHEREEHKDEQEQEEQEEQTYIRDHTPPPSSSPTKRLLLFLAVGTLVWLAFFSKHSPFVKKQPEIIYAKRYSKEFKYRPAASPIITETLEDGRIRIRGAEPTKLTSPEPTPQAPKAKGKTKKGKKGTKRKKGKKAPVGK
ncbi:hypothetical protein Moror_14460 [Moniliophthora roreri MCA 2997]|uniref:Uncharacterized protein n=2 Tax=Moniliophthora roreri TaxID=221103 RepID=V2WPQ4_MONRO|nr:hypothetical protein Moror_14460 [Moniliophthora roreri MCA 2997]KAI3597446.1 hypothetical protein WG66_013218 [Moniliophthora roreri]